MVKNAETAAIPVPYCDAAKRLLDAFGQTVRELIKLHESQFLAIVDEDSDAGRFDLLIHEANENKQQAKYAYLAHLSSHGCAQSHET